MSAAALLDAPGARFATAPRERAAGGRRPTLEELLDESWRTARSHGEAECPVCHAAMQLDNSLARCGGCGTTLA
jgi:hypothetical protein